MIDVGYIQEIRLHIINLLLLYLHSYYLVFLVIKCNIIVGCDTVSKRANRNIIGKDIKKVDFSDFISMVYKMNLQLQSLFYH